jgi:acetamidase/formamidase
MTGPIEIQRFDPDPEAPAASLVYTFGGHEPVAQLRPGAVVSTWTRDAFNGAISTRDTRSSTVLDARYLNPQTGPFLIDGAEPGDTLAVHFVSIAPREDWGVSTTIPFFGSLTSTPRTASLQAALPEQTWIYAIDASAGLVRYEARDSSLTVDLPLDPMHGTVGVAPPLGEVRSSLTPGSWGGNMDTPELRAGVTCYFGVNVPGAMLSLGDGHARQGEGETCGVAVEAAMDSVFVIDLIKGVETPWPRLENDDFVMSAGSARPLEDAFRIGQHDLVTWVAAGLGLSHLDAYQLVTQTVLAPVANVVDTDYTVVAKVAKAYLPGFDPYLGMHARMRAIAQAIA